jgi:hypothetical protein
LAYDSKARPSAEVIEALRDVTLKGWAVIRKYYPELGMVPEKAPGRVNPSNDSDNRFYATLATEDSGNSPIPLISMICSLDAAAATGRLARLRSELLPATQLPDYSTWDEASLRQAFAVLTTEQTTVKGVRYRAPRNALSFQQSVELYAILVALFGKNNKWQERQGENHRTTAVAGLPDLQDFSKRLAHQLPIDIPPGATRAFLLYLPGWDLAQPVRKGEFEERMDVVRVQRRGAVFHLEEFQMFLTNDQKEWNPEWIEARAEAHDNTLSARKYAGSWTRLDGPYMWFKPDQFTGAITYRSTVRFEKGEIVIEGERFVRHRGDVVRTIRDPEYDPLKIERFAAGVRLPDLPMLVELPEFEGWPDMRRMINNDYRDSFYRADSRELFWYKTQDGSWGSSLLLRDGAGEPTLRPTRTAPVLTRGVVARYDGSCAQRASDANLLTPEQQRSMNIAVQIMNACLVASNGSEIAELRTALPHDETEQTPIYFYSVRNGTSVVKAPTFEVVVLAEGYYSDVASAFNRLLWVVQKPIAANAAKAGAAQSQIKQCISAGPSASIDNTARAAWTALLSGQQAERLFDPAILPTTPLPQTPPAAATGDPH